MNKPENFVLTNVKKTKNGGLTGKISFTKKEGERTTHTEDWDFKNTDNPDPALISKLDELKPFLAMCYGMNASVVLSRSKGLKVKAEDGFKLVGKLLQDVYQQNLDKIEINGIAISGTMDKDKDNRSVVIMGTQLMDNGVKCAINSPKIKLSLLKFSFEEDLTDVVDAVIVEVIGYLYEGKRAQLTMFNETGDPGLDKDFVEGNLQKVS